MRLFAELKRRNVLRAAVLYAGAVWALAQGIAQLTPVVGSPEWVARWFLIAACIGFPFWIAFAWFYEFTPGGIKRESEIAHDHSFARATGRKLDRAIIAVLAVAVVLLVTNQFVLHRDATSEANRIDANAIAAALAKAPQKSIAVLPLANESGDKDQQYFSDGLSEDLINALSQFDGLKVISRNSSFKFRNSRDSAASIGAQLGVAHLLEGSVRRLGDEVRITAALVKAADGSTVWSQQYDRPYKGLFALQDAITREISGALKARLLAGSAAAQGDRPPGGNLEAWQAYQQGNFYLEERGTEADLRKALDHYTTATRLDPRYAAAYARLSIVWNNLGSTYLAGAAQQQAYAQARATADTALALAPELAMAHSARGAVLLYADYDWRGAQAEYQRAAQLAPNDTGILWYLGNLDATLGRVQSAVTLTRKVLVGDPLAVNSFHWLSAYLSALGRLDEAGQAIDKAIELQPAADSHHAQQAVIAIQRGDAAAALQAAQKETGDIWHRVAVALALQIGSDYKTADAALQTLIDKDAGSAPYQIAEVYALRRDADNTFMWLDRAWAARDPGVSDLLFDPFILRYRNDPRFAAFATKVGLPTSTDAKAMP